MVRPERRPQRHRQPQQRLVSHRRRRRLLHRERPARLERSATPRSQDGNTFRYDLRTGQTRSIRPIPPITAAARPQQRATARRDSSAGWRSARSARSARGTGTSGSAGGRRAAGGRSAGRRPRRPWWRRRQRRPAAAGGHGLSASSGARRSCSRTTIRTPCTWAAIACSSRRRAATRGWRRPT